MTSQLSNFPFFSVVIASTLHNNLRSAREKLGEAAILIKSKTSQFVRSSVEITVINYIVNLSAECHLALAPRIMFKQRFVLVHATVTLNQ